MASGEEGGLFEFLPEQAAPERVGGGLPRLRFAERMQTRWRPVSLDGLLPDDHRGRLLWMFVECLVLTALLATIKAVDGRPGYPPADPRILLALWLYATVEGIGSAREVARLCDEHIAFEWLCGGGGMNAKTLADFRVDHGAVLECLLVDSFTALVRAADEEPPGCRRGEGFDRCVGEVGYAGAIAGHAKNENAQPLRLRKFGLQLGI